MAVIKGRFIYNAFYQTVEELINDEDVSDEYLVHLVEGAKETTFVIKKEYHEGALKLKNGLFAQKVISGNAMAAELGPTYTSSREILHPVGGVKQGETFLTAKYETVFDKIFYGDNYVDFTISDAFMDTIGTTGIPVGYLFTTLVISYVNGSVTHCKVKVNGVTVTDYDVAWGVGTYRLDYSEVVQDTFDVEVLLTDSSGNVTYKKVTHVFRLPVYFSPVDATIIPTTPEIQTWNVDKARKEITVSYSYSGYSFALAAPAAESVKFIQDENGFNCISDFSKTVVYIQIGQELIDYNLYISPKIYATDYKFKFLVGV